MGTQTNPKIELISAFKFMEEQYADTLLKKGEVRIGTLYDFKQEENNGNTNTIYDQKEGEMPIECQNIKLTKGELDSLGIGAPFLAPQDAQIMQVANNAIIRLPVLRYPNSFIYCYSNSIYRGNLADAIKNNYSCAIMVTDRKKFIVAIEKAMIKEGKISDNKGMLRNTIVHYNIFADDGFDGDTLLITKDNRNFWLEGGFDQFIENDPYLKHYFNHFTHQGQTPLRKIPLYKKLYALLPLLKTERFRVQDECRTVIPLPNGRQDEPCNIIVPEIKDLAVKVLFSDKIKQGIVNNTPLDNVILCVILKNKSALPIDFSKPIPSGYSNIPYPCLSATANQLIGCGFTPIQNKKNKECINTKINEDDLQPLVVFLPNPLNLSDIDYFQYILKSELPSSSKS